MVIQICQDGKLNWFLDNINVCLDLYMCAVVFIYLSYIRYVEYIYMFIIISFVYYSTRDHTYIDIHIFVYILVETLLRKFHRWLEKLEEMVITSPPMKTYHLNLNLC